MKTLNTSILIPRPRLPISSRPEAGVPRRFWFWWPGRCFERLVAEQQEGGAGWHGDTWGFIGRHGDGFASPWLQDELVLRSDLAGRSHAHPAAASPPFMFCSSVHPERMGEGQIAGALSHPCRDASRHRPASGGFAIAQPPADLSDPSGSNDSTATHLFTLENLLLN